jgi:16S rRNA (cytidine1402-2'-O)-methyltransferase
MIRRAAPADIPALVSLEAVFPSDRMSTRNFQDLLRRGCGSVLVYEDGGTLLGDAVVLYRRNSATARIYSLVVEPKQALATAHDYAVALGSLSGQVAANGHTGELHLDAQPGEWVRLRLINAAPSDLTGVPESLTLVGAPYRVVALDGHDLGLLSEAGLPAVADPGALLVEAAHAAGVGVLPLAGASSLLLALAASGLNGQSFAFVGYLPQDATPRATRLRELEALSLRHGQTQLIIETPYRNVALMSAMLGTLAPTTRLSVSCGLTLPGGWSRSDSIAGWRSRPVSLPDRVPAVFALLARP